MAVQLKKRLLTIHDYHRMMETGILSEDDPIELLNGELIEMSPIGSRHGACVKKLNRLFNRLLIDKAIVGVQDPVQIPDLSEPEPDVAILKPRPDFYAEAHPKTDEVFLIIEVADASLAKDREVKLPIYAAVGIPEYWIVNLEKGEIEAYLDPREGTYQTKRSLRSGEMVHFRGLDLEIPVDRILV